VTDASDAAVSKIAELGLSVEELSDAWVYVFGRYLVVRQEHVDLSADGVDYNVLKHNPAVLAGVQAGQAPAFVNPNLDVVYSEAWIAVDEHTPAILEVPAVPAGTYYTAQIVDEWAEITFNLNERTFPQQPHGTFALCLAGSDPELPDGALRLDLPSRKAKLLARVQIGEDLDGAVALQHGSSLRSAGSPQIEPAIDIAMFTNSDPPGAAMFAQPQLDQALAAPDRSGHGEEFAARLARIAAFVDTGPANAQAIDELVRTTIFPSFIHAMLNLNDVGNGWHSTDNRTGFGEDYHFRAIANFGGIWWNSATEVIYYLLQSDQTGKPPTGDHTYAIRFPPGHSPGEHVDGYWSITLYSHPEVRLVPNAAPDIRSATAPISRLTPTTGSRSTSPLNNPTTFPTATGCRAPARENHGSSSCACTFRGQTSSTEAGRPPPMTTET
jgi:hypothetical protein